MHTVEVEKHPTVAFLLSLFPGVGHLYLGKYVRTLLYGGAALVPLALLALYTFAEGPDFEAFFVAAVAVFLVWCVNLIDMAVTLTVRKPYAVGIAPSSPRRERTIAALLSLLPGVGHLYLGDSRKGLALFVGALGGAVVPVAAAVALREETLLLGWLAVPALIALAAIDAVERANRTDRGDGWTVSLDEDAWFRPDADGRRPVVACFLSAVPGVGHFYLGAPTAGLRLLGALLALLYLRAEFGLNIAVYLVPLLWCWAFFDVASRVAPGGWRTQDADPPLLSTAGRRWVGAALIALGVYAAFDRVVVEAALTWLPNASWLYEYRRWAEPMFAAAVFFGIGIDLLRGRSRS